MKILLAVPPSKALTVTPPLGLGYLAAVLLKNHYEVSILDSRKEFLSNEKFQRKIRKINPDVLGISVLTSNYHNVKIISRQLKKEFPRLIIVLGGPHPTALPELTLKETKADFVIRGEGEISFLQLIKSLDNHKGKFFSKIERVDDLDKLPFPAWDLMLPNEYSQNPHQFLFRQYPVAPIITSRGCPFGCTFCSAGFLFGKELRRRSPKNVVDEIELLVKNYGVKEIHFEDDNFTLVKKHVQDICQEIIRRKISLVWQCPNGVRIDTLGKDLIQLMKKSGCYRLAFGLESGSPGILRRINKKLDLRKVTAIVKMVKSQGIETQGFFILGLPGETEKTVKQTFKFIRSLKLDLVDIALLAYLPGSVIFKQRYQIEDYSRIKWNEVNYYTGQSTGDLSIKRLKELQRQGMREFYLKPKTIKFLLKNVKIQQFPYIAKVIFNYLI